MVILGSIVKRDLGCKRKINLALKQKGGRIIVAKSIVAALPKVCVGLGGDLYEVITDFKYLWLI